MIVIFFPGSAALSGLGFSQVSQVSGVYLISPWKVLPLILRADRPQLAAFFQ